MRFFYGTDNDTSVHQAQICSYWYNCGGVLMMWLEQKLFSVFKSQTIFRNFWKTWNANYDMTIKCFGWSSNVSFSLFFHPLIMWLEVVMMDCTCRFCLPHVVWVLTKYVSNNLPYHRSSWNMFVNKVSKRLFNLMWSRRISTGHSWWHVYFCFLFKADLRLRMILRECCWLNWWFDFYLRILTLCFFVILLLAHHIILHYTTSVFLRFGEPLCDGTLPDRLYARLVLQ